jgi:hypothetical protein
MDENYLNKRDILNEYYRKNKNKAVSDDKNFLKHNFPDFVNF